MRWDSGPAASGMRLMCSTPDPITQSCVPDATPWLLWRRPRPAHSHDGPLLTTRGVPRPSRPRTQKESQIMGPSTFLGPLGAPRSSRVWALHVSQCPMTPLHAARPSRPERRRRAEKPDDRRRSGDLSGRLFARLQHAGQRIAAADVELLEDVSQVRLDGAVGDEEAFGDLAVGPAICGQPGDAEL